MLYRKGLSEGNQHKNETVIIQIERNCLKNAKMNPQKKTKQCQECLKNNKKTKNKRGTTLLLSFSLV